MAVILTLITSCNYFYIIMTELPLLCVGHLEQQPRAILLSLQAESVSFSVSLHS